MPKFSITRRLPYTADQLFAIASDIESYPLFVPLVRDARILNRSKREDGAITCDARLDIAYLKLGIHESFSSKVVAFPDKHLIQTDSSDGPLKKMTGEWVLRDLPGGGAEVRYKVDYSLKSKMLQIMLSGMFDLAMRKLLSAFERRANQLYGRKVA
jgi:coenzyme Q-binding protein COQ10